MFQLEHIFASVISSTAVTPDSPEQRQAMIAVTEVNKQEGRLFHSLKKENWHGVHSFAVVWKLAVAGVWSPTAGDWSLATTTAEGRKNEGCTLSHTAGSTSERRQHRSDLSENDSSSEGTSRWEHGSGYATSETIPSGAALFFLSHCTYVAHLFEAAGSQHGQRQRRTHLQ